jgi:predicted  nucleic acid-binding Zn-ribbon protein
MLKSKGLENPKSDSKSTLKNLEIEFEALKRETEKLFEELEITPEKIQEFQKESNYTEEEWNDIQKQKTLIEESLQNELDNYRDPGKAEKAFENLRNSSNWTRI